MALGTFQIHNASQETESIMKPQASEWRIQVFRTEPL